MLHYNGEWKIPEHYMNLLECCELYLNYISGIYALVLKKSPNKVVIDKSKINWDMSSKSNEENEKLLLANGFLQEAYEKKLFKYLLSDFLIHMQESLKNASEYKPQIALILARKPLIDDIYYLQLLLVNAKKAVNLVLSEDNSKDNFKKDDEKLSRQALDILKLNVETDNMFYKIRYGENGDGLLAHCNKASHIATSRTLNTNPGELNFVFLDGEGIEDYTVYYCEVIVTLLHYVAHMIAKIYEMQFKDISLKVALDLLDVGFIKLIREGDNNEE